MTHVDVAAYYFPQFHTDPRNDQWHGEGWTEWELLRHAQPRFAGHRQPIVPAWGYFDEADPAWAERQIDLAADHAVTTFLYDWYWYRGQPFLHRALERGYLRASNRERVKFAIMWANHDWNNLFPTRFTNRTERLASGRVSLATFDRLTDYVIAHYFSQPSYFTIDGAPYFSLYDLGNFIAGLGSIAAAADALATFREKTRARGFPDLHLNAILWGVQTLPGEIKLQDPAAVIRQLGFSSATSYTWMHHFDLSGEGFPHGSYRAAAEANFQAWEEQAAQLSIPYFPNVTMGWDSSPRTTQSDRYAARGYPWLAVLEDNTPQAFQSALQQANDFLERQATTRQLLTINAWNEWTEGSYLLPDTVHGTAYLEAVRAVFGALVPSAVPIPD